MRVGFVGLGVQGKGLAENIQRDDHELMVFDARPEAVGELVTLGAAAAPSLAAIGKSAELVIICVRDDDQVKDVLLGASGILAHMTPGNIVAIHSTVADTTMIELGEIARASGVEIVDAPVSGGARGAAERSMSYILGGSPEAIERCKPVFAASGDKFTHVGDVGAATRAKLIHQAIMCVNMMAAHEGMRMGLAAGIEPESLRKVMTDGGAQSWMTDHWFDISFRPAAIPTLEKDLGLALKLADRLGIDAKAVRLAERLIEEIVP
ncbi:NAD(P)-dependent oxidoreductase [Sphingobium sp. TomTYG45]